MAQGIYKSGEIIKLTYQAVGALSNAIPVCKIYDEANLSDTAKQSVLKSALLAGEKAGGRYFGYFTPDAEGKWTVCIQDKNGDGKVSKTYEVCGFNVDALGDAQIAFESGLKSDALIKQSSIISSVKSDALVKQALIISSVTSAGVVIESGVKSAALVDRSAIVSSVKSDALVKQSSIISSVKSALLVTQSALVAGGMSDVKSAILAQASDVKSAVLAAGSPAMVS